MSNQNNVSNEKNIEIKEESNNIKINKWTGRDFTRIIFCFLLFTITFIVFLFIALAVALHGVRNAFEFAIAEGNYQKTLYTTLTVVFVIAILFFYYYKENKEFLEKPLNVIMLLFILLISIIVSYLSSKVRMYARPFALCALLSLFLINRRAAFFNNCIIAVLMLLFDSIAWEPIFDFSREEVINLVLNLVIGNLAIFVLGGKSSRIKILLYGFVLSLPTMACAYFLEFTTDVSKMLDTLISGLVSGILSVSLLLILMPFFENIFKCLTDFRLAELVDHRQVLLKEMQAKAPGTFSHVVIVATLVEACSNAIGENPLLGRACAYYHDVGKIKNAEYFAENQSDYNPHNDITPELSADIIRAHTQHGAELIRKFRLPDELADAAIEHHGTMTIRYFLAKAKQFTDGDVLEQNFSYPGPKPHTKINAILMICDASEAATRSLADRSHENVDRVVREVLEERIDKDQFSDCGITFKDLDIIRLTITNTLSGVYHKRVKYPKLKTGAKK